MTATHVSIGTHFDASHFGPTPTSIPRRPCTACSTTSARSLRIDGGDGRTRSTSTTPGDTTADIVIPHWLDDRRDPNLDSSPVQTFAILHAIGGTYHAADQTRPQSSCPSRTTSTAAMVQAALLALSRRARDRHRRQPRRRHLHGRLPRRRVARPATLTASPNRRDRSRTTSGVIEPKALVVRPRPRA